MSQGVPGVFRGCPRVFRGCSGVFRGGPGFTNTHLPVLEPLAHRYIGDEDSGLQQRMILDDIHTTNA